jgi:hypothetical protein
VNDGFFSFSMCFFFWENVEKKGAGYDVELMTFAQEEEVFPSLPSTTGELQLPEKDADMTTEMEKPKEEKEETNTDKKRKSSEKPTEKKVIFVNSTFLFQLLEYMDVLISD